ncbi:MAG: hypothetical protein ACK4RK_09125 [Gemmataceae bacterium]
MNPATRETILRLLFPALLVVFVYFIAAPWMGSWGDMINPSAQYQKLQESLSADRQRTPHWAQLSREQDQILDLREQLAQDQARAAELRQRWESLTGALQSNGSRAATLARVENLLSSHNLLHLEQGPANSGNTPGQLPPSLQTVLQVMTDNRATHEAQLVRFRFVGRYLDVLEAVGELAEKNWHAIPVSLSMEEADLNGEERIWTLLVWM